ncbi:MAG: KH domain-containing protein, partial [Minisyncoccales bacterium]
IGDTVVAKITSVNKRSIDLTIKGRNLGKVDEGLIVKINSHKVPKIIGKEGVRVNMIKNETGCNITIGQNGIIVIVGSSIEKELIAKEAILFLSQRTIINDVTTELEKFLKEKNKEIKEE